ncbi:hypothetical protein [Pyrococcus kukulkanii]|uniref:hypothetical protein n=1 Tax=Pyrococcus kukulkanii TaxID=1609559 RepID=UPI00356703CC
MGRYDWAVYLFMGWGFILGFGGSVLALWESGGDLPYALGWFVGAFLGGVLTGLAARHALRRGVSKWVVIPAGFLFGFIAVLFVEFVWLAIKGARGEEIEEEKESSNGNGKIVSVIWVYYL